MKLLSSLILAGGASLILAASAHAADLPTKKAAIAPIKPSCFDSFNSWLYASVADCPLTYQGVTLYGTIDMGVGYETHGVNFNRQYPTAVEELISKNSQGGKYTFVPGGISQSNIGVKISEPLFSDWSVVGRAETGFDPYSLQLSNGPSSLVDNNTRLLANQNGNGDSSRAGQWFNSQVFGGLSSKTFGTLVWGRVNTLTLDTVNAYDPMGGSYAFSPIGYSGFTAGAGSTETARSNSAFKYNLTSGWFRAMALAQTGGYAQGNASSSEYQGGVGFDYAGLSADLIYTRATNVVSLANFSTLTTIPAAPLQGDLKATLSNDTSVMLAAKYTWNQLKIFGGYEYIRFTNPDNKFLGGFTSIGGITVPAGQVNSTAYNVNRVQQVFWTGARYSILSNLDVAAAYYHYNVNNYRSSGAACAAPSNTGNGAGNGACSGNLDAYSMLIDYKPIKRVDLYAGFMYSQVGGGLASGFLHTNNIDPTAGLRVQF